MLVDTAISFIDAGLSVIPCDITTKRPRIETWKPYQYNLPTYSEAGDWFAGDSAIAVVAGCVSGHLEIIDFDTPTIASEWLELLKKWHCQHIVERLLIERSQSGGHHVAYRSDGALANNQKLARLPDSKIKIETRGEGGYCVVAPSIGYRVLQGGWQNLSVITPAEREALLAAARMLDEPPPPIVESHGRVGDDYNARASIDEIVIPLGWERSGKNYWVRPSKDKRLGHSATWDYNGSRRFNVFTTSAGIDARSYDLFGLYAHLHHGGNFVEATKAAAASGYGAPLESTHKRSKPLPPSEPRKATKWLSAANIEAKEVDWLVYPYIPLGEVTLLVGDPGVGKSTLAQAIATAVTKGTGTFGSYTKGGNVIFMSAEQSPSTITIPRFKAMGADLAKIILPDEESGDILSPFVLDAEGLADLSKIVAETKPALVVVDTITAYFEASRSMKDANEVREWMRRLVMIARDNWCAVLALGHLNKATMQKSIYRVAGSVDFVGAARSVLSCSQVDEENGEALMTHIKTNVGPKGMPIPYTVKNGVFGYVRKSPVWDED